ncbi:hypothetical protein [Kribbella sp. CA-247076]|uniref:hypothetical protein n=1 Tax=Kribbella sp. CA-247076 TaxID=3239941 RepID=UPI003D8C41A7
MTATLTTTGTTTTRPSQGKGWVLAGIGAGLAGIATVVTSSLANAVYDETLAGNAAGITDRLAEQTAQILAMHTAAMLSAVLLVVFAAGLHRYLRTTTGDASLLPQVASSGLLLVSVALLMGSALTTEFVFGVQDPDLLVPETAAFFGHWIGTVPWLWAGTGLTALALGLAGRKHHPIPTWLTWTSLTLGALTLFLAISPAQYMSGMTGPLWLTITALGLLKKT